MKKHRGRWNPSSEQVSVLIDCAAARMPLAKAAELVGVAPRALWIFVRRIGLPSLFGAWKDRPRYAVGARTGKSVAAVPDGLPAGPSVPGRPMQDGAIGNIAPSTAPPPRPVPRLPTPAGHYRDFRGRV
jgi:hypothetical protein